MTPGLGSPICEWWLSSRTQTDSIDVTSDADHHDILPRWNRWCNSPGRGMYSPPPFPPPLSSLPQAQKHDPNVQMHMTPKTPHTQCRQMRCAHHCKYMLHSHLSFYSHFPPSLQTWEDVLWSPGPPHLHGRCTQTLHRFMLISDVVRLSGTYLILLIRIRLYLCRLDYILSMFLLYLPFRMFLLSSFWDTLLFFLYCSL